MWRSRRGLASRTARARAPGDGGAARRTRKRPAIRRCPTRAYGGTTSAPQHQRRAPLPHPLHVSRAMPLTACLVVGQSSDGLVRRRQRGSCWNRAPQAVPKLLPIPHTRRCIERGADLPSRCPCSPRAGDLHAGDCPDAPTHLRQERFRAGRSACRPCGRRQIPVVPITQPRWPPRPEGRLPLRQELHKLGWRPSSLLVRTKRSSAYRGSDEMTASP